MRTLLYVVLSLLAWTAAAAAQERVPLTVETAAGVRHEFQVEIAATEAERNRGLMYRQELAPDHGMLFVFARPTRVTMWMKNTPLPLDMLFIGNDGRIVDLHERAVPYSLDTIAAGRRARYVLEVNGGTVERLGLAVGDRVTGAGVGG
ncbi:DUF192 domain-containing protein [Thalassobaculum fulvum]|uniref:DUF192 domain-containing protein n=1 Tax=Thalassobaculum fulvum TaxID=1633335 RepID=UPI001673C9C5|nr:DUF192 domain-containing protein [Thalassobaculum fulvum]